MCPLSVANPIPETGSHNRTVVSREADASHDPSDEKAIAKISSECPMEVLSSGDHSEDTPLLTCTVADRLYVFQSIVLRGQNGNAA